MDTPSLRLIVLPYISAQTPVGEWAQIPIVMIPNLVESFPKNMEDFIAAVYGGRSHTFDHTMYLVKHQFLLCSVNYCCPPLLFCHGADSGLGLQL